MALTPVEIRHLTAAAHDVPRLSHGEPTDRLFEEIAASFEDVWRERADLADKVEQLEADLVRFRELESLLRTTLVSAEQASAQTRDAGAPRGGADPQRGARRGARDPAACDRRERAARQHESRRLRAQLQEALSAFGTSAEEDDEPAPATVESDGRRTSDERSWYGRAGRETLRRCHRRTLGA